MSESTIRELIREEFELAEKARTDRRKAFAMTLYRVVIAPAVAWFKKAYEVGE